MRQPKSGNNHNDEPIGLTYLLSLSGKKELLPSEQHFVGRGRGKVESWTTRICVKVPRSKAPRDLRGHLEYALKNEAIDLRAWFRVAKILGPEPFLQWVIDEPTGRHSRRAWFLFEFVTEELLPLPNREKGNYVNLANEDLQITAKTFRSSRHRVNLNLLGNKSYCPLIRKTTKIQSIFDSNLNEMASRLFSRIGAADLTRSINYSYQRETKASFDLEREEITQDRLQRFAHLLNEISTLFLFERERSVFWLEPEKLVELQNRIVEPKDAVNNFRSSQNYVGQTDYASGSQVVYYPCPPPEILHSLINGWLELHYWNLDLHPILLAALIGFGFVFIHPFEDGNGRIHRFLIHAVLCHRKYFPQYVIIPVSATMLKKRREYDEALERHSRPIMSLVDFRLNADGEMDTISEEYAYLYRYWDATPQCEYLYSALEETIRVEMTEEIRAIRAYDAGRRALLEIVDMANRKADLMMKFLLQNGYKLPKRRRKEFAELSDEEILRIETAVRESAELDYEDEPTLPFKE